MSNRTWVCVDCKKSYRRDADSQPPACPSCKKTCEYVDWKIRIPSPKDIKRWNTFWKTYRAEKAAIREFETNPNAPEIRLSLQNRIISRKSGPKKSPEDKRKRLGKIAEGSRTAKH